MKKYIILITVLLSIICCHEYAIARSWSDLDAGEHKIYGREREEKYRVKAFFYEVEDWENHYSKMIFWLYKYTDYPKYTSTRFLPFYYGLDSKIDNRSNMLLPLLLSYFETDGDQKKSFIVCPLYYSSISNNSSDRSLLFLIWWGKDNYRDTISSYQTIIPVFYHSSETNTKRGYGEYIWVNPLFISWKYTPSSADEKNLKMTLLFGRKTIKERDSDENAYSNFWFPIIPVFYRSNDKYAGTHTNIAWLIDWRSNTEGELDRFWFIPFVFHKPGKEEYKFYIPFYCRPSGATESEGYTFGIFHYYEWSESGYYLHFFPLYWSWETEKSQGRLILPLYYQYKDDRRDIYINGLGIAKSAYMGPFNPSISASLANKDNNWYLDTEISWLYEVFSSSARVPIKNPFSSKESAAPVSLSEGDVGSADRGSAIAHDRPTDQKPALTSGVERKGRENSEVYWGWKILFGWIAYEKADSQKHVRFFPLTWLTWNENSDDKVYVFLPFFAWYLSEDTKTEYFALFPFYLMQKEDQSYLKLYVLNLYIDEYNAEEDCYDKSIVWPFINWYSSPNKNGFRIFPFFWRKNWNDGRGESSSSMLLPFYRRSVGPDSKSLTIFPALLHFSEDGYSKTKFIAGTYWHSSENYERANILYIYDHKKYLTSSGRSDEYSFLFKSIEFDFAESYKEMRLLWSLLLKYEKHKQTGYYDIDAILWLAGIERNGDYFHNRILPLYWYSSDRNSYHLIVPPVLSFFSKYGGDNFDLGVLGILYYRNENRYAGTDRKMWLLGALYNEVKYPERKYHARGTLWGILWDYETEDDGDYKKFTILKGLYKYINNNGRTEQTFFWIL